VREEGGTLIGAQAGDTALYQLAGSSGVHGRLVDAVHGGPAAGAVVFLSGTPFAAITDEAGSYRIDNVPPGRYALSVSNDWMADLELPAALDSVTLAPFATETRNLATPAFADVAAALCPRTRAVPAGEPAIIHGVVHDPGTGEPLPNVTVRASFGNAHVQARTDFRGSYRICGVQRGSDVVLRVTQRGRPAREVSATLHAPFTRHDFR
jgi:protocatechuate 3,4-dioxygenase beta subunit